MILCVHCLRGFVSGPALASHLKTLVGPASAALKLGLGSRRYITDYEDESGHVRMQGTVYSVVLTFPQSPVTHGLRRDIFHLISQC
jgi:hypothetical protein